MTSISPVAKSSMAARPGRAAIHLSLIAALLWPVASAAQDSALFPRPPELAPAVQFWTRVYTEVDTASGFLHDPVNLSVVYERLPNSRRQIEAERGRIRDDLLVLAGGQRQGLSETQQNILALWGEQVTNDTLRAAAGRVRWQLGQSNRFRGGMTRSGAYREHIERVIREKNLPMELAVLPHVESSFNPKAYSSAAAAGMWQFGRATARRFMRVDHIVDERMDPYIATYAAMSLLEYNYSVLKTWPLALTAYNHGAGGISRAVRRTGTTDIETIVANYRGRAFGFASRNFYAQFLAVLDVEANLHSYFGEIPMDPAPDFREIELDAYVDAAVLARSVGISLEQLQADNPALRPAVWEGSKRIPRGFTVKVRAAAVATGDLLAMVPDDYKFAIQTPDVAYVVQRGDNLGEIARRFDTTVDRLASMNQLASRHRIQIGQRLLLPQANVNPNQLASNSIATTAPDGGVYTVQRGDTVSLIARRFGIQEQTLLATNGIRNRNRIYPGQRITLPGFTESGAGLPPATTSESETAAEAPAQTAPVQLAVAPPEVTDDDNESAEGNAADRDGEAIEAAAEPPVQLALNEEIEILPPAAVLPDNVELERPVSPEEEQAPAIDPAVDSSVNDRQLTEVLATDPSDYTVGSNNTIEIQALETLGHYADWLGIRAWDIRRLNNMAFRDPLIIGERLRLDFTGVGIDEFEQKRREFHSSLQREFFSNYRIQGAEHYRVKPGDNIGGIAQSRYTTPLWLLRQYNPELDFERIQIGQEVVFPLLERAD